MREDNGDFCGCVHGQAALGFRHCAHAEGTPAAGTRATTTRWPWSTPGCGTPSTRGRRWCWWMPFDPVKAWLGW